MTSDPIGVVCGQPVQPVAPAGEVRVTKFVCPMCEGHGRWESGERCMICHGCGLADLDDVAGWGRDELKPAPRPPAVMKQPCADCAFRPHSPERENGTADTVVIEGRPFYCHHGLHDTGEGYTPTAYYGDQPLGAMLCASWWDLVNGRALPTREYRDPPERGPM